MNELRDAGLIRHIGLSNVNVNHLKRALESNIAITWLQVEMDPLSMTLNSQNFAKRTLLEFKHGLLLAVVVLVKTPFLKN